MLNATASSHLSPGRQAVRTWLAVPMAPESDLNLLRNAFRLQRQSDLALCHLANAARLVRCPVGPFEIASPRRPEPSWWLLSQGVMGLGTRGQCGNFREKRTIRPGDWLETAGAMTPPGTWLEQAECRTAVELVAVPLVALNEACTLDPALLQAFAAVLAQRVRELSDSLYDMGTTDVTGRVARWLLRHAQGPASDGTATVTLTERKGTIAQHLGTTSESLSRALRRMSDASLVEVHGYELRLRDLEGLRRLASPAGSQRMI